MILTVDLGNSRIKWALWEADEIVYRAVTEYEKDQSILAFNRLYSEMQKSSSSLINRFVKNGPERVFAVCVVSNVVSDVLSFWVEKHWHVPVEYLKTEKQYKNIVNAYDNPSLHGVDRWAGIIAACQNYSGSSICVIGAGTAITFDYVEVISDVQKGVQQEQYLHQYLHKGGYIVPSFGVMYKALMKETAKIRSEKQMAFLRADCSQEKIPDNTSDSVNQGLHVLLQSGIRELCDKAKDKLGKPAEVVITGGYAPMILSYPDMPHMNHEPDLIMKGLYSVLKQQNDEWSA